jgi:radial spoke head protein 3
MARKGGVDKKCLTEDNELFLFDDEVQPILECLCGQTLELSRMEVLEEEELREMKEQQDHYKRMVAAEVTDISRMENNEAKKLADFEKMKANALEKKKQKNLAHKKVVARQISKNFLAGIRENAFNHLKAVGHYTDNFQVNVLDNDVVPFIYDRTFDYA